MPEGVELPGSFRRRGFQPDLLMPQEALLRRGRSGRCHSLLREMLPAGNQCRVRQKGGNGSWRSFIIQ